MFGRKVTFKPLDTVMVLVVTRGVVHSIIHKWRQSRIGEEAQGPQDFQQLEIASAPEPVSKMGAVH